METAPPRRPSTFSLFPATSGLLALIVAMFGLEVLLGGSENSGVLLRLGANYAPLVAEGEIWRLLATALLHVGPFHLLMNGLALWQLGRFCEITFGSAVTLTLFVLTAITGSLLAVGLVAGSAPIAAATGLPFHLEPRISAGASGALFGLEGALVAFFLRHRESLTSAGSALLRQLLFWSVGMMVFSFMVPGIDWMAHLGGLIGGLAVGWALPHQRPGARSPPIARGFAVLSVVLLAAALGGVVAGQRSQVFEKGGISVSAPRTFRQVDLQGYGPVLVDDRGVKIATLELQAEDAPAALEEGLRRLGLSQVQAAADVRQVEGGFLRRAFVDHTSGAQELGGFVQARCASGRCVVVVALAPGDRYGALLRQLSRIAATARPAGG